MAAPTRTFPISLAPDLQEKWEQINADTAAAALIAGRSTDEQTKKAAQDRHDALLEQRQELEDQIAAAYREITVTRLDPKTWARLTVEHPPRPGDPYDERMGVNTDTFDQALMPAAITTVVDARGDTVDLDWAEAAGQMSAATFQHIISTTIRLHTERDAVPFSLDDWRARQT